MQYRTYLLPHRDPVRAVLAVLNRAARKGAAPHSGVHLAIGDRAHADATYVAPVPCLTR